MDTSLGSTDDSRENNDDENMAQKLEAGGRTTDASGTSDKGNCDSKVPSV